MTGKSLGPVTAVAAVIILAVLPFLNINDYLLHLLFITFIFSSMSSAWNILGGYAGQISFGFSAFFGLGAYTTVLMTRAGVDPYLTLPVGALVAAVFSVIVGYPTFRLRGPYFAIATLGVGEAVRVIMLNWNSLTGGASGLDMPTTGNMASKVPHYFSALILVVAVLCLCKWIIKSKFGLGLFAIKANEEAADSLGINPTHYKLYAHALAAVIVGIAGGLYARYMFYIEPNGVFGFSNSIMMLMMPVVGGVGTLWGPVLGAVVFGVIQDQLMASYPELALLFYGVLLIVIVMFEPGGVMGLIGRIRKKLTARGRGLQAGSQESAVKAAEGGK